jgi:hypothetical protein
VTRAAVWYIYFVPRKTFWFVVERNYAKTSVKITPRPCTTLVQSNRSPYAIVITDTGVHYDVRDAQMYCAIETINYEYNTISLLSLLKTIIQRTYFVRIPVSVYNNESIYCNIATKDYTRVHGTLRLQLQLTNGRSAIKMLLFFFFFSRPIFARLH